MFEFIRSRFRQRPKWTDEQIADAVCKQMEPLRIRLTATVADTQGLLDLKQARLNKLKEWSLKTENKRIRRAQLYWIKMVQYTIDNERDKRARQRAASEVILPPLPKEEI